MTAPSAEGKSDNRHRTTPDTDRLLYAVQRDVADALDIPVQRLTMNRVIAALATVGHTHLDEVVDALRG